MYQLILLLASWIFLTIGAVINKVFFFFFCFLKLLSEPSEPIMDFKTGRFDRSSYGSLTYLHIPLLGGKRIDLVNDLRLTGSGSTVRSGFQRTSFFADVNSVYLLFFSISNITFLSVKKKKVVRYLRNKSKKKY